MDEGRPWRGVWSGSGSIGWLIAGVILLAITLMICVFELLDLPRKRIPLVRQLQVYGANDTLARTRTGESVRALSDWDYVTTRSEVGVIGVAETLRVPAA
jgi:hypothetical protein